MKPSLAAAAQPYKKNDRTHGQIDPEAYRIVTRNGGVIEPGQREDRTPRFRGLSDAWWQALYNNNVQDFYRLVVLCRRDFPTFAALLGKIVSRLDKQRTPLIFNNGQNIVWNKKVQAIEAGRMPFLMILKARQFGISCQGMMENFWAMWGASDIQCVDVAHDDELSGHLVAFYSLFYDSLPKVVDARGEPVREMRPQLRSKAKNARVASDQLEFPEKNCIGTVLNAKKNEPRGMSATRINLREAAFYPDLRTFWEAIEPQLPSIGTSARLRCSVVFETTPNGENDFYDFWVTSKDPESEMIPVFLPWFIHDDEYTATPPAGWRMSAEDVLLQAKLTLARQTIDGKKVTREQMYWRYTKVRDAKGGIDWFDREYPSDDTACFLMKSSSAFAEDMKYMLETSDEARMRSSKIVFRHVAPSGIIIETPGPTTGNLDYKASGSPLRPQTNKIRRPNFIPGDSNLWVWEPPAKGRGYFIGADVAGGDAHRDSSSAFVLDLKTGRQVAKYDGKMGPEDYADFLVHLCALYNMAWILPEINGLGAHVMKRMIREWSYPNIAKEEKWDQVSTRADKRGFFTSPNTRPILLANLKYMITNRFIEIASRSFIAQASQMKKVGIDDYRTVKSKQHDDEIIAAALACLGVRQSPALFAGLYPAQQSRIPTAVDLGLSHQDVDPQHDDTLRAKMGEEKFEKLFGTDVQDIPWNPMQPISGFLDY